MATQYSYQIGTSLPGTNLETLSGQILAPQARFWPSANRVTLDSGGIQQLGLPVVVWRWGFINKTLYDALRAICPGASASVYIRTTTDDQITYGYYSCKMHWPAPDALNPRSGGREGNIWADFQLEFRDLVGVSYP